MSAKLASPFDEEGIDYTDPSKKFEFFSTKKVVKSLLTNKGIPSPSRGGLGWGWVKSSKMKPIPIPAFPLKGKELEQYPLNVCLCISKASQFSDLCQKTFVYLLSERDAFKPFERRESAPIGQPGASCKPNLFFGFFHDGTGNNFSDSIEKKNSSHTNVARLSSCYPGRSVPGVGTAFTRVGDTGARSATKTNPTT